jgi:hypothetical protein
MGINNISFWKQNQNWRSRQKDLQDQLDVMATLTDTMSSAGATLANGLAMLAGQAAAKRVVEQAKVKSLQQTDAAEKAAAEEKAMEAVSARLELPDYVLLLAKKVDILA